MPPRVRRRSRARVERDMHHGQGQRGERDRDRRAALDDRAARLDRARLGELELALHQAVSELAGLDEERLPVPPDLLAAVADEHGLEGRVAVGACRARGRAPRGAASSCAGYAVDGRSRRTRR